jgi:hypothetical protein
VTPRGGRVVGRDEVPRGHDATLPRTNNQPLAGVHTFVTPICSGNDDSIQVLFSSAYGVTDANGQASFTLSLSQSSCEAFCTDPATDCATQIQVFDQTMTISSNIVSILDGIQ